MMIRIALTATFLLLIPGSGVAQLKPEQTLNRRAISEVSLSSDGERVAFTVSEPAKGTTRSRHVWMLQVRSRELQQFTSSAKSEFAPHWSRDGLKLAFLSDREDGTQIYLIPANGGEAVRRQARPVAEEVDERDHGLGEVLVVVEQQGRVAHVAPSSA